MTPLQESLVQLYHNHTDRKMETLVLFSQLEEEGGNKKKKEEGKKRVEREKVMRCDRERRGCVGEVPDGVHDSD